MESLRLVSTTSITKSGPNQADLINFDNNKIIISLTMKINEVICSGRPYVSSFSLTNFDHNLTNCEILHCCLSDLTVSETVIIVIETVITVTESHFSKIVRSVRNTTKVSNLILSD